MTAANSSGINDGAAALVMMTRQQAEQRGLTPRMRIRGWAVAGCGAEIMGFGPSPATRRLMDRLNMDVHAIDLIELNEAFAARALAVMNDLRLDPARVNVNGGAIALGHPVGASGAILPVKLMYEMARSGARTGLVTMCIGGGGDFYAVRARRRLGKDGPKWGFGPGVVRVSTRRQPVS